MGVEPTREAALAGARGQVAADLDGIDADDPRICLLFDPQTARGLLAGVPAERSEACHAELRRPRLRRLRGDRLDGAAPVRRRPKSMRP